MAKGGLNAFGCIGHLVIRVTFNSVKVDIVINDPSLTSNTWSTCSSIISPMASLVVQSRLRMGSL
ncbi:hypothetical protein DBR06_SOUSAS30510009, partial [Sousa chinensis]